MLETIFSPSPQCFFPIRERNHYFSNFFFCRPPMPSIWTSLKICKELTLSPKCSKGPLMIILGPPLVIHCSIIQVSTVFSANGQRLASLCLGLVSVVHLSICWCMCVLNFISNISSELKLPIGF